MTHWIKQIFAEKGEPSSKRVFGGIGYIVAMSCIAVLTVTNGATEVVKDLVQTLLFTSATLLGLYAVTKMFNNNNKE